MTARTEKPNASGARSSSPDHDKLVERILVARPDAQTDDVRRLAPTLADVPDKVLAGHIARAKRRLAQRVGRRIQK